MEARTAIALVACLATAGCLGLGESTGEPSTTADQQAPLPAAIHDERRVERAASPAGSTQGAPCQTEASTCFSYPFHADRAVQLQARLDWGNATNDFDLHVVNASGERVASSNHGPPGTREELDTRLDAGGHELVVVAWAVQEDTYDLDAQFGYP